MSSLTAQLIHEYPITAIVQIKTDATALYDIWIEKYHPNSQPNDIFQLMFEQKWKEIYASALTNGVTTPPFQKSNYTTFIDYLKNNI